MANPLAKLLLKPDEKVFLLNPPREAPPSTAKELALADAVVLYAGKVAELVEHVEEVRELPRVCVCYPKPGQKSDLGREKVWMAMVELGFEADKMVSLDENWSAIWFKRQGEPGNPGRA